MTISKHLTLCSILLATGNLASAAVTTLYDFTAGNDGWVNIQTSTTGSTQFSSANDPGIASTIGNGLIPTPTNVRDLAGNVALWARSPEFTMPVNIDNLITFNLYGGALSGAAAPVNDAAASLTSPTVNGGGFQGMLLRRVSDGAFILSTGKGSNSASAESFTWNAATINGAIAGDGLGETYTLDLVDEGSGAWGWIAADTISVTAVPEPSTSLLGLAALGLLARRRR